MRLRHFAAWTLSLAATAAVVAQDLPSDWFFDNRPEELKALEGKPSPDLKVQTWIGDEVTVQGSKGKVMVIDFWATWCGPCMAAVPHNVEIVDKYKSEGLVFVGVHDANSGWDTAPNVVQEKKINYPVARDAEGGISAKAFGLGFWPTYIVVDKAGIVRGAGLTPSHVEEAVKKLLSEAGPAIVESAGESAGLAVEMYLGGDKRPRQFKSAEGKPAPALAASRWNNDAGVAPDLANRVTFVAFVNTKNALSMKQASELAALEKDIGPQGVSFVVLAGPDDSWDALQKAAADGTMPSTWGLDSSDDASKTGQSGQNEVAPTNETPATASTHAAGTTARAFGVTFTPVLAVIDRAGVVRAVGLRPDKAKEIANLLLAETIN